MAGIEFSKEETDLIVHKIKTYFEKELSEEIGQFDAEFLLEFFSKEIGPLFYNRGLLDAQAILELKMEDISQAFYEIEKPTEYGK
jgi:uncharacterized protein (DUF2164 family)